MMADARARGKGTGKVWVALTVFVVIATAIWVFYSRARQARKRIEAIVWQIEHGDKVEKTLTIRGLYGDLTRPDQFAQVFPHLIQAMKDESEMVREAAASVVGDCILGLGRKSFFRFGRENAAAAEEREPTIVALCPKAEEALVVLLDESSPMRGCDLRMIRSLSDVTDIPTARKSLIIVAAVDHVLYFRIFDGDGRVVVDIDEQRLMERTLQVGSLKKRLESLWPPHELTQREKDEVITAVGSIVDWTPGLRARAAKSLGFVAEIGKRDAPPPRLVACLDDEVEQVRTAAAMALIEYRQGPELFVPVALRRMPKEGPSAREEFSWIFWHIRFEPSVLPFLIEGLSSENGAVCLVCTAAINHMGRDARPALPAILTLIRKELAIPHPPGVYSRERIVAMAAGAIGELSPEKDPLPGAVELLCDVLRGPGETGQVSDASRPVSPAASTAALKDQSEFRQAEAAWSLGILGRSAESAVPLLLSTFEAAPKASDNNLREIIAESLVEITRGMPDEDRVIASLVRAWKTSPQAQKTVLARALRNLGAKSEQVVPELRQFPADESRSRIRRVRYPRSRREVPVRE
jgi:preprotein translocase subunit YajC